ncbi:MAG: hypothetical protein KKD07_05080, partial [Candidatus Omnitrophica bacterium]|nr:hypothetical protein [Candidatus Omnitrophota bacterium]
MKKNILLIRTFIPTGIGGPVPPLESLYIFSQIVENCISSYNLKIIDMGIGALSLEDVSEIITDCKPSFIIFQSLAWEAEIVHRLASFSKKLNKHISTIVTSQLAFTAQEFLLTDTNIDFVLYGEADLTIPTLLNTLDSKSDLSSVEGIIFREEGNTIKTTLAKAPSNLDDINISSEAWDSIDVKAYSKYSNWNGSIKEDFYIPILSSRGCPFTCEYCRDNCSKQFIPRSPENVISEIKFLNEKYGAKEFHFFDSVFNYDIARAKRICELIIDSKMNLSLAFPHGLRADLMTDELIDLLKKAGTYKLVYGIETASQRLQ